jgi:hypothetical protein
MAALNDMENFNIDVAPPKPLTDVTATLDDLLNHAELYYQVRRLKVHRHVKRLMKAA